MRGRQECVGEKVRRTDQQAGQRSTECPRNNVRVGRGGAWRAYLLHNSPGGQGIPHPKSSMMFHVFLVYALLEMGCVADGSEFNGCRFPAEASRDADRGHRGTPARGCVFFGTCDIIQAEWGILALGIPCGDGGRRGPCMTLTSSRHPCT